MTLELLRRKKLYSNEEPTYKILRLFGFDVEFGEVHNKHEMMTKAYSKSEICEVLGINHLKDFRLKRFCKKQFHVGYWMVWTLEKLDNDLYAWDYYDWLM